MPLGLNLNERPTRSLGAPSKTVSLAAEDPDAYGLDLTSVVGMGVGAGGGVGALRMLALIEANFGCMGLYLSFLDCGATGVLSSSKG